MSYEKIFTKGKIGNVETKNKLVMSPMGIGLANLDGTPTDDMIAFYEERAKGGAGIIIPEITRIDDVTGAGLMRQLSVSNDKHIKPLSKLADAIHKHNSKLFIQLHHPGRQTLSVLIGGQPVVAPSAIPSAITKEETRELSISEIKELVQKFIDGAKRVKAAGCDGVELHGAHGYLINQFMSPFSNKRTDEYGGSFENRMRFVKEIVEGIKKECSDFPLVVRISADEFLRTIGLEGEGITTKDGVEIAKELEKYGVDAIDVSCGTYESMHTIVEPISFPEGWRRDMVKTVKDAIKIPVIAVGVIREPQMAEKFLEEGIQDFVSMGRPWLCDPNWANKAINGKEKEIRKCVCCLRCFQTLESFNAQGMPPECSVNPRVARELRVKELAKVINGEKAVVVGGGPAGMNAALTLAKRGVKTTLIHNASKLGGTLDLATATPHKEKLKWISEYYTYMLKKHNVDVVLNKKATAEDILRLKPDGVILATGGKSIIPKGIKGVDGSNVHTVEDVLLGKSKIKNKNIVVIGAGLTGLETAEYLCENGNKVTIVDMLEKAAPTAYIVNVLDVTERLKNFNVEYKFLHSLKEIKENGVILEDLSNNKTISLDCDDVVLSVGFTPNNTLERKLQDKGIKEIVSVGTAIKDSPIAPAMRSGFDTARKMFIPNLDMSYNVSKEKVEKLFIGTKMNNQETTAVTFLTDPSVVEHIVPQTLTPYPMPIAAVYITRVNTPNFTDPYYEAILGVFVLHNGKTGLYGISLLLDGEGAEMATQSGRDKFGFSKKMGAKFDIRKEGNKVYASVSRKGKLLAKIELELGEYNSPLAEVVFNAKSDFSTTVSSYNYLLDTNHDENHKLIFNEARLYETQLHYDYKKWDKATAKLELNSSIDDPWGELPINTIIGGTYNTNDLDLGQMTLLSIDDGNLIAPYLMRSRYDESILDDKFTTKKILY